MAEEMGWDMELSCARELDPGKRMNAMVTLSVRYLRVTTN